MFTRAEARDFLLRKLGITVAWASVNAQVQLDVAQAINYANQTLNTAGEDFFIRSALSVAFGGGASMVTLGDTVQSVLGPVRLPNGTPLRALSSRGQLDSFGPIYLQQTSFTVSPNQPMAYWVESLTNSANATPGTDDSEGQINLWLVPPPNAGVTVTVEGVQQVTRFEPADFLDTGSPAPSSLALPVPNRYAEAVFLPIAAHAFILSNSFSRADLIPIIEAEYQAAMKLLPMRGGFPPAKTPVVREVAA